MYQGIYTLLTTVKSRTVWTNILHAILFIDTKDSLIKAEYYIAGPVILRKQLHRTGFSGKSSASSLLLIKEGIFTIKHIYI